MRITSQPRPRRGSPKLFKTEAEMCDNFAKRARAQGYEVYPETGGWDLLLVWTGDAPSPVGAEIVRDEYAYTPTTAYHTGRWASVAAELIKEWDRVFEKGMQIGIQAKLRPNVDVLSQCIDLRMRTTSSGPDHRAVLVPYTNEAFNKLAEALGLKVFVEDTRNDAIYPSRIVWDMGDRVALPPIVPSWSGGRPSPRNLSVWRIGALKICARLRNGEELTKTDFAAVGVDHRSWVARGWIIGKRKPGNVYGYKLHNATYLPDIGYEAERDALAALGTK